MNLMQDILYPYQRQAVQEIISKRQVLLADQPGLGKTLEVLGAIESSDLDLLNPNDSHAILILTPIVNARSAWLNSIERYLKPQHPDIVTVDLSTGSSVAKEQRLAEALSSEATHPIVVVANHDAISRVPSLLTPFWSAVVIDESHLVLPIVTPGSLTRFWKALSKLKFYDVAHSLRIAVSGTPDRGKLENRYGTWLFLDPSIVKAKQWAWLESTFHVYERKVARNRTIKAIGALKDPKSWLDLDRRYTIRRTKEEVLPELPPKTYHFIELPMELEQYRAYKEAESIAIAQSEETPNALLTFAIQARQLATYTETHSNKLEWLTQWLSERGYLEDVGISEGKVVIASQFVRTLKWLQGELDTLGVKAELLTGDLTGNQRADVQRRFQDPADPLRIVLLSGTMGVGIDLDIADDLIMLDLPYDPDKLEQIEDRVHRASNMHKVTIWHLLSLGSIDIAIADKVTTRLKTTRLLLDGSRGVDFSRRVVDYITGETETD